MNFLAKIFVCSTGNFNFYSQNPITKAVSNKDKIENGKCQYKIYKILRYNIL